MKTLHCIAAMLVLLAAQAAQAQWSATVLPSQPSYLDPVFVRITPPSFATVDIYGAQVSMSGTNIVVRYQGFTAAGTPHDVMLGRFPAGTYTVNVMDGDTVQATTQFTIGPGHDSGAYPGNVPSVNYTDMWWNPAESGMGLSIYQGADSALFGLWFVYDPAGNPVWYSLQPGGWGSTNGTSVFNGLVYKTSGPWYGGPFDPTQVKATVVGTGKLTFTDYAHATFEYTIEGNSGTRTLQREPIQ